MDLRHKRDDILRLAAQYGARNLRVFGSVAHGDDRPHSDLDLLVDMGPDRSLLDIVGLGQDLEELLDRRVDVLTGASLHPAPRQHPGRVATAVKDERVYLSHSRDAITDIEEYTSVNRDAFMATRMRQDARHSEARDHSRSRKLSIAIKDRRSEIP
jgi:predicted nucleotidyltransferase